MKAIVDLTKEEYEQLSSITKHLQEVVTNIEQRDKSPLPYKDSFIRFYVLRPIARLVLAIASLLVSFWHAVTGAWYCDYCQKWHGRRVHKRIMRPVTVFAVGETTCCSKGIRMIRVGLWTPPQRTIFDNLADAMKEAFH